MNEREILTKIVNDLNATFPTEVDVRTDGGDQTVNPPELIMRWRTEDLGPEDGRKEEPSYIYEDDGYGDGGFGSGGAGTGKLIGIRRVEYRRMNLTILIRYQDELDALDAQTTAETYFKPFEDSPDEFDQDTTEWRLGSASPGENAFVEPDWYSISLPISFTYSKHYDEIGKDVIEDIDVQVEAT